MDLNDEELREFAKLWEQEFKETLTLNEARIKASLLLELYGRLYKPLQEERSNNSLHNLPLT
jgi:hypothetical protein